MDLTIAKEVLEEADPKKPSYQNSFFRKPEPKAAKRSIFNVPTTDGVKKQQRVPGLELARIQQAKGVVNSSRHQRKESAEVFPDNPNTGAATERNLLAAR
jgi:hypothetical protein